MCYFFSLAEDAIKIQERFKAKIKDDLQFEPFERANAFNYPALPIIIQDNSDESSERFIDLANWGLIPFWTKNSYKASNIRENTLNARAESIFEKPSYMNISRKKRCLIPSTGFFEWQHLGNQKTPFQVQLRGGILFAFGGLYDDWVDKTTGETFRTFTIITTEANPLMSIIHNTKKRMPLIIPEESESNWLDTNINENQIKNLLLPFDEDLMVAVKI